MSTITAMEIRRRFLGLTQTELARRVNVTQPEISLIESGQVAPKPEVRTALANILEMDPLHLQLDCVEWHKLHRGGSAQ